MDGNIKRDARKMKKNNINNKTIRTDLKFSVSMAIVPTVAILAIGSTKYKRTQEILTVDRTG